MTRTTTGSSRLTVILSWMIALICFVGGALYIWKMPSPDQEAMDLQMKQQKNQKSRKSLTEKVKQEQAQRALPANYARQLVEQSEVLVKKNLEEQVKKFQTMAETMRRRKDDMLAKVEKENCRGEHLLMRMIHRKHGLFLKQEIRQPMLLSKNFMLYYVTMRLKSNKTIWL